MSPLEREIQLAEEIVSVLPEGVVRECSPERSVIRYGVRAEGLRLRTIVLNRLSLRRLMNDPAGPVKIDYLKRELLTAAQSRTEFRYPRLHLHVRPDPGRYIPLASSC